MTQLSCPICFGLSESMAAYNVRRCVACGFEFSTATRDALHRKFHGETPEDDDGHQQYTDEERDR